jgi:hypothetical protein
MTPYGIMIGDAGLAYLTEARNKFHITLNIKTEEGREILKKFVRKCDVLIETFKPGYMDSLGIGYRQLREINPGLIYCAIYTYGQFGEESEKRRNQPDYDLIDQARGVVMSRDRRARPRSRHPEGVQEASKARKLDGVVRWRCVGSVRNSHGLVLQGEDGEGPIHRRIPSRGPACNCELSYTILSLDEEEDAQSGQL